MAATQGHRMMATLLPFPVPDAAADMPLHREQVPDGLSGAPPGDDDAWGAWMARAQAGDTVAYHALLGAIVPYLRAIARRYLGAREDAEDAVQDILLIVHGVRHTYEPGRPFKPWLGTIATRRCIDVLRRRARRIEHEVLTDEPLDRVDDATAGPEEAAARRQAARDVRAAVAQLSPRQQQAIELVHLKDMSLNEASAESRQSVSALKVACHRALKSLQHALGKGKDRD